MYKIIGADGKEYGPISADQLRQWIAQGRVNANTKVKGEGEPEWQTVGTLPDFASQVSGPPPLRADPIDRMSGSPKTSGLAISSLVLGILGFFSCGLTALIGLILGIVGLKKVKKSEGQLSGGGLAIGGIVTSGVSLLLLVPVTAAMLLPALAKAKLKAQSIQCISNVKQISLGVILHANANTNQLPSAATWCDDVAAQLGHTDVFQCKASDDPSRSHYAYNKNLDGVDLDEVNSPATTVLIFESIGGWNVSGDSAALLKPGRHRNHSVTVGFVDGHVEQVTESRLGELKWEP